MIQSDVKDSLVVSAIAIGVYGLGWIIGGLCRKVITKTIYNNNVCDLTEQGYEIAKSILKGSEHFNVSVVKPINAHRHVGYLNPDGEMTDCPFYFPDIETARRAVWLCRKQKRKV